MKSVLAVVAVAALSACGGSAGDDASSASSASSASEPVTLSSNAASGSSATASLRVHYPAGWGHRITLHCSTAWGTPIATTWTSGDIWTAAVTVAGGASSIDCKPLFDDATWAAGPNWTISAGASADLWPHFFHTTGAIQQVASWHSNVLNDDRGMWIYLPPSYDENANQSYPVVYMHDGQNLFYDEDSSFGTSWNVGGAMDDGIASGAIAEAIVIGIDNDANRTAEYTPVADPDDGGGDADAYLSFVITELKPQIDGKLRTESDAAHTVMLGSSLGALVSLYAGMQHPDVFGAIGVMSPATWWDNNWVLGASQSFVSAASTSTFSKLYMDSGDTGIDDDDVTLTAQLAAIWQGDKAVSVDYLVQHGGSHSETYWRQRVPGALAFLLGPRR